MAIQLMARQFLQQNSGLSLHSSTPLPYLADAPMIDRVAFSRINTLPNRLDAREDATTRFPAEIPAGETGIRVSWTTTGFEATHPFFGRYRIRHNLDEKIYSIALSDMSETARQPGLMEVDIPSASSSPRIDISGPSGPMPDGWYVEMIKTTHLADYDNPALPKWHATRFFAPEFLALLTAWRPHHFRFMKAMRTEESDYNELHEYPKVTARHFKGCYPIEAMVGLCNHVGMGGWFNLPMNASDALIDWMAEFIADNMNPDLPVIVGHGNEHWNLGVYMAARFYVGEAFTRFGTQGAGTVTVDKATYRITNDGQADFTALFGGAGKPSTIAVSKVAYEIRTNTITPTTMEIVPYFPGHMVSDAVDAPWFYNHGSTGKMETQGYTVKTTLAMKRVVDIFKAKGQRTRLTTVFETQLAGGVSRNNNLLDIDKIWTTPDYVDPMSVHDAIAVNPYFGSGSFKNDGSDANGNWRDDPFTAHVRPFAEAGDHAAFSAAMRDYMLDRPIADIPPSKRSIPSYMRRYLKEHRQFCDLHGLRLLSYEGGQHIVHSVLDPARRPSDADIVTAFEEFMRRPESIEMYQAWVDAQIAYLDGPVMKFQFFDQPDRFGIYGLVPDYSGTTDSQQTVLSPLLEADPWWTPDTPPRAVPIPPQSWTAGVDPGFDLKDYVSVNARSFTGDPPPGMSLDANGVLIGTPLAGSGTYVFKVSNMAGSIDIPVTAVVS